MRISDWSSDVCSSDLANHERSPGIGPLAGWRGTDGSKPGKGAPNPDQLARYVDNQCFWRHEFKPEERYFKHGNRAYLDTAVELGLIGKADPIVIPLYSAPLQRFRPAAAGPRPAQPPAPPPHPHAPSFPPPPPCSPPS